MEHKRWIGSHEWKRSTDVIDGYPSFNERRKTETQDLDDIIIWLEYGKTSGYIAARQSKEQEEYWAGLIRNILCEKLIKELMFFSDNTFQFKCTHCNDILRGTIINDEKNIRTDSIMCEHIEKRYLDIFQYVLSEFGEWQ